MNALRPRQQPTLDSDSDRDLELQSPRHSAQQSNITTTDTTVTDERRPLLLGSTEQTTIRSNYNSIIPFHATASSSVSSNRSRLEEGRIAMAPTSLERATQTLQEIAEVNQFINTLNHDLGCLVHGDTMRFLMMLVSDSVMNPESAQEVSSLLACNVGFNFHTTTPSPSFILNKRGPHNENPLEFNIFAPGTDGTRTQMTPPLVLRGIRDAGGRSAPWEDPTAEENDQMRSEVVATLKAFYPSDFVAEHATALVAPENKGKVLTYADIKNLFDTYKSRDEENPALLPYKEKLAELSQKYVTLSPEAVASSGLAKSDTDYREETEVLNQKAQEKIDSMLTFHQLLQDTAEATFRRGTAVVLPLSVGFGILAASATLNQTLYALFQSDPDEDAVPETVRKNLDAFSAAFLSSFIPNVIGSAMMMALFEDFSQPQISPISPIMLFSFLGGLFFSTAAGTFGNKFNNDLGRASAGLLLAITVTYTLAQALGSYLSPEAATKKLGETWNRFTGVRAQEAIRLLEESNVHDQESLGAIENFFAELHSPNPTAEEITQEGEVERGRYDQAQQVILASVQERVTWRTGLIETLRTRFEGRSRWPAFRIF
jgi:hypothetical protein